mmetsp:Transcript_18259/g.52227  ORF Transcript_18259/g.52227 Transcript_18259/m.52227 type:complete len:507 (+) Transcript_18259:52-1572(+)
MLKACSLIAVLCGIAFRAAAFSPALQQLTATSRRRTALAASSGKGFGKPAGAGGSGAGASSSFQRDEALDQLLSWSDDNGIVRGKGISVAANSKNVGGGVGIRINRPGKAGDEVMSIPRNVVVSSQDALSSLTTEEVDIVTNTLKSDGLDTYASEFFLMLRLLQEVAAYKGRADRQGGGTLGPWLDSLPTEFDMGIYFDDLERSYLPQLASKLLDLQERQLAAFRKACDALADHDGKHATLFETDDDSKCAADGDTVKWAFSIVFSRSWRSPSNSEDARMVPLADNFNHGEEANVIVEEPEGDSGVTRVVLKNDDVERGTELKLSYGPGYDPSRFLIIFGFFDETVREVFCGVAFTDPSEELVRLGASDRSSMIYRDDGAISNAVWDSTLYVTLAQKPDEQRAFYEARINDDAELFQALHRKYRLEIALSLKNHAEAVLQTEYLVPTDQELSKINVKEHPQLPMILKHNRFMRKVFGNVKDRLEKQVLLEVEKRRAEVKDEVEKGA